MRLKAVIFDVDGTLAETEEAHRTAFNHAFAEAGHDWVWTQDLYRQLLKITGGRERLASYLASIGRTMAPAKLNAIHERKNLIYSDLVATGSVTLRPGVARLIDEILATGLGLAIATTTSRANVEALISQCLGPSVLARFDAVVTGEDVAAKKPDPEAYERALKVLGVAGAACVAIEDSRAGLAAAMACDMPTLVTPSFYMGDETFEGAAKIASDLDGPPIIDVTALDALVLG